MTEFGALGEAYRDLSEIDRRREGVRFTATLPDGMAVVALAIAPDVAERVSSHDRFATEFERAASMHHEGLVPPVAWGSLSDGSLHCAYARVRPQEVLSGSLPPATVGRIGVQIARALAAAHGAGVVHGAICTSRIVTTGDRAQLSDVGLYGALSEGGLGSQATAALLNDAPYTSPEVQLGQPPDARADIYSLGASLYELLTGKPPYGGRTTAYVLASVLSDEAEDTGSSVVSPVVEALIRAIEQAPEDRWPSAAAFAAALSAGVPPVEVANEPAKARRGCLPVAAVAGFLLVVAGLLGVAAYA
jgi:eukaryotic-like serine/threonine-protein kinase